MTLRIGHRGAAGYEPENTLRAIECAIRLNADFAEIDVQLTKDKQLVVFHDKKVDRITNGQGYISDFTLNEIRYLNVKNETKIATLEEVLEIASDRIGLMIEIITPGIAKQVVELVQKKYSGLVIYASFLHAEIKWIKSILPSANTLALIEAIPVDNTRFAEEAGATHVGISCDSITKDFVKSLHHKGFTVFVYTVNDPRDINKMLEIGVDGIISDYPDRLK